MYFSDTLFKLTTTRQFSLPKVSRRICTALIRISKQLFVITP